MRRKLMSGAAACGVAVTAMGFACSAAERHREPTNTSSACTANAARANLDFAMKDMAGRAVKLADYKGKVLLLDFWATWCGPCRIEIPGFVEMYDTYRSRGLEVVGVVVLDEFRKAAPFARQFKMNYTILDGNDREDVENAYGPLFALPTTFIIGRDGRICQKHVGLTPRDTFENAIKQLMTGN
jgi:peroxiredoxin